MQGDAPDGARWKRKGLFAAHQTVRHSSAQCSRQGHAPPVVAQQDRKSRRRFVQVRQEVLCQGDAAAPAVVDGHPGQLREEVREGLLQMGPVPRLAGFGEGAPAAEQQAALGVLLEVQQPPLGVLASRCSALAGRWPWM
ncbi:hypothetical protein A7D27_24405 [Pseudomonas sp. 1D4]|nr:hypothetical protein A7D27_24405 [Pseudomonas sp. 1D4]